jgi:outer membrane receptor protein involved in Fe transport
MKGVELGADYRLTREWKLLAGLSFSGTRYLDFVAYGDDLSGQAFIGAPRRKANVGVLYRANERLQAGVDVVYQDGSASAYIFGPDGRVAQRRSDAAAVANANASFRIGVATVNAYVRNLFDRHYITNNQAGRVLDVSAPRTVGVAVRYDM